MLKSKLNYWELSDRMCSMMNTRQDNNVTYCIGAFYVKNDIELS